MANLNASRNILTGSRALFGDLQGHPASLLGLQKSLSEPDIDTLVTGTSLLNPAESTQSRLRHFPEGLYNLRPQSHLTRFLKALLGDSGVGQLRKRILMARLWSILSTTHFYDLDRFYGAIFGVPRNPDEILPIDPMTELATPDGWDEIMSFDARYRERLMKLAKAIPLGGTPQGMQLIAEALTGVDCEVYEIWSVSESTDTGGNTYQQVATSYSNYATLGRHTWADIEGRPVFGKMGSSIRNEVVIRPKKTYDPTPEGERRRAYDANGIRRVVDKLKPAGVVVTIDDRGVEMRQQTPIASIHADSEYWDVVPRVIPQKEQEKLYDATRKAYDARDNPSGLQQSKPAHGKTPFYEFTGQAWSAVPDIRTAEAWWSDSDAGQSWIELGSLEGFIRQNRVGNNNNYDVQVFPTRRVEYSPNKAYIDPKTAVAGSISGDGVLTASPYSAPRTAIGNRD